MRESSPKETQALKAAFEGDWKQLLPMLRRDANLISLAGGNGYTPLHQAAWHGAGLSVIGELLAMGADRAAITSNRQQTAQAIAAEKHPTRDDLQFVLQDGGRTISQLMRKLLADNPAMFSDFDGGRIVYDRMIASLNDNLEPTSGDRVFCRVNGAFAAVTGGRLGSDDRMRVELLEGFDFDSTAPIWRGRLTEMLADLGARACTIPFEPSWTAVGDLFDPPPHNWHLRGDTFLWLELRQILMQVPLQENLDRLRCQLEAAFFALVGEELADRGELFLPRLARGGMSSGMISMEFWSRDALPLLVQRAGWLWETWRGTRNLPSGW